MYQGNPTSRHGLLYGDRFREYDNLPDDIVIKKNYTDVADRGDDFLCSINYAVDTSGTCYITDVVYTNEPMEVTEPIVARTIESVDYADIESNNGGRGFARKVMELVRTNVQVLPFTQNGNKESRITTNAASVLQSVLMPRGWHVLFPDFYVAVTTYKRKFTANKHDDAPDVLTGIFEKKDEINTGSLIMDYNDL